MSNIFRGSATEDEIKAFIGGRSLVSIYAKNKDTPNLDGDYPFWSDIRHPETGRTLHAVKGYCEPVGSAGNRLCYYAEYSDENGVPYYYVDSRFFYQRSMRGTQSIAEQQEEDRQELRQKISTSPADEEFLSKYREKKTDSQSADEEFFNQSSDQQRGTHLPNDEKNGIDSSGQKNKMDNGII